MRRILLDGRALQPEMDGIGRFITSVSGRLSSLRPDWDLTLLVSPGSSRHLPGRQNLRMIESRIARFRPGEKRSLTPLVSGIGPDACLNFSLTGPVWDGRSGPLCPTSFVVHDTMVLEMKGYFGTSPVQDALKRMHCRNLFRISLPGSAAIAVPTRRVMDDLCRLYPEAERKTTVVYEGQDLFDPAGPRGVREGGFILYVGNARPYKNLPRLLAAYEKASGVPDLVMVVRRDREFPAFERAVRSSGASGRTRVLSAIPDDELTRLYRSCTAFVSPSIWEGFGLPVLEAMAAGCPVIASRGTALEEVAGDGALLVDPTDVDALAGAITEICGNPGMRAELSARASSRAALFGWDSTAGRIAEMLEGTMKP